MQFLWTLDSEWVKRKAEQEGVTAEVVKLSRTLPLIAERTDAIKTLMLQKVVARQEYLELAQERIEKEQDLASFKARFRELSASISENRAQLETLKAEAQKNNLKELNDTNQQISGLEQELVKARQRNRQQVLSAPISGTIEQLAIHTIGGIVTPAQELMQIVPQDSKLEVEAFVLNKDIGFVEEGQEVEVKIDAFDFTKYGMISGEIVDLSNDAMPDEQLGLVYHCRVQIDHTDIQVKDKWVNLSPGMSVMVEIKTGKRKLIEYFLSPIMRYKQEAIRER